MVPSYNTVLRITHQGNVSQDQVNWQKADTTAHWSWSVFSVWSRGLWARSWMNMEIKWLSCLYRKRNFQNETEYIGQPHCSVLWTSLFRAVNLSTWPYMHYIDLKIFFPASPKYRTEIILLEFPEATVVSEALFSYSAMLNNSSALLTWHRLISTHTYIHILVLPSDNQYFHIYLSHSNPQEATLLAYTFHKRQLS